MAGAYPEIIWAYHQDLRDIVTPNRVQKFGFKKLQIALKGTS